MAVPLIDIAAGLVAGPIKGLSSVLDKWITSDDDRQAAASMLAQLEQGVHQVLLADATGEGIQRWWRPVLSFSLGMTLVAMLWINYIIGPIMVWLGKEPIYAPIPDFLVAAVLAFLGIYSVGRDAVKRKAIR